MLIRIQLKAVMETRDDSFSMVYTNGKNQLKIAFAAISIIKQLTDKNKDSI